MSTLEYLNSLPETVSHSPKTVPHQSPITHPDVWVTSDASLCERLGSPNLKTSFEARIEALESVPETRRISGRIKKCSKNRRCGSPHCLHCGAPGHYEHPDKARSDRHRDLLSGRPPRARNFRIRGGQRAEIAFRQFPDEEVHVFTIHLRIVPLESDVVGHVKSAKEEFLKLARRLFPDGVLMGGIEDDVKRVSEVGPGYLANEGWRLGLTDDDIVVDIHIQGALWLRNRTRDWLVMMLKRSFPGDVQVRVVPVRHDFDAAGRDKYGLRGWLEYSNKRFLTLEFGGQNRSVFLRVASYRDRLKTSMTRVERNVRPIMSAYLKGIGYSNHQIDPVDDALDSLVEDRWMNEPSSESETGLIGDVSGGTFAGMAWGTRIL